MSTKNVIYIIHNQNLNNKQLDLNMISNDNLKSPIKSKVSFHSTDTDETSLNTQENDINSSHKYLFTFPRNVYKFWVKKNKKTVKFKDFQSKFKEKLVDYIEVESYKKYNKINSYMKENQKVNESCSCIFF